MKEQLSRTIRSAPTLHLNPEKQSIFDFEMGDITIEGYDPHPRSRHRSLSNLLQLGVRR